MIQFFLWIIISLYTTQSLYSMIWHASEFPYWPPDLPHAAPTGNPQAEDLGTSESLKLFREKFPFWPAPELFLCPVAASWHDFYNQVARREDLIKHCQDNVEGRAFNTMLHDLLNEAKNLSLSSDAIEANKILLKNFEIKIDAIAEHYNNFIEKKHPTFTTCPEYIELPSSDSESEPISWPPTVSCNEINSGKTKKKRPKLPKIDLIKDQNLPTPPTFDNQEKIKELLIKHCKEQVALRKSVGIWDRFLENVKAVNLNPITLRRNQAVLEVLIKVIDRKAQKYNCDKNRIRKK